MLSRFISFTSRSLGLPPHGQKPLKTRQIRTLKKFFNKTGLPHLESPNTVALDLGCGGSPRNPFNCGTIKGIDIAPYSSHLILQADLSTQPIPFDAETVDAVTAFDFIEHVPRYALKENTSTYPFVALMNEIYRVLKPGGVFFSKTPAYPFAKAFVDPTHLNIITEDTWLNYFCDNNHHPLAKAYGFEGRFRMVRQRWWGDAWLLALMQKHF